MSLERDLEREIKKKYKKAKKRILNKLGNFVVQMILDRTRVDHRRVGIAGGNRVKIEPLKQSTISRRRRVAGLHPSTSPETSNLTMKGDMLNSLTFNTVPSGDNFKLTVYFNDPKMSFRADVLIAGSDKMKPRPFMDIGRTELKKIEKLAEELIQKEIDKL